MAKTNLANASIEELRMELIKRQKQLPRLEQQRAKLLKKLAEIDKRIAALNASTGKTTNSASAKIPAARAVNPRPLTSYIVDALNDAKEGMRITDIAEAVSKAGYVSNSKDFYSVVAMALRNDKFVKTSRGVYSLKGEAGQTNRKTKKAKSKKSRKRKA